MRGQARGVNRFLFGVRFQFEFKTPNTKRDGENLLVLHRSFSILNTLVSEQKTENGGGRALPDDLKSRKSNRKFEGVGEMTRKL